MSEETNVEVRATDLASLMAYVDECWEFNPDYYPGIRNLVGERETHYMVRHISSHVAKLLGIISTQVEAGDHGVPMDQAKLLDAVAKMVVLQLKLAALLGVTSEKFFMEVRFLAASTK